MTYEEAKKDLKSYAENSWGGLNESFALAIEAIDKQIPRKPNYEGDGYDDDGNLIYDTWICPNCEDRYEVDYEIHSHCPTCGQSIDWSEHK